MEDEQQKHEILTNGPNNNNDIGSPESPNLKTSNNINKEQDRFLPIANVRRIMKKVIPGNGKISKDAKETVQECISKFISFVTGEASDKCQREKRKTINGDDIIWAITTLGFEDYVAPLKLYLSKYREIDERETLNIPKQQQRNSSSDISTGTHSHFTRSKGTLDLLLKTFREEENNTVTREGWTTCVHVNAQTSIPNKPSQVLGVITPKTETWSPEDSPWRDHAQNRRDNVIMPKIEGIM